MSTEPQTKLTLLDRLLADSPAFWKKVNYLGLIIGAIVAAIQTQIPEFPKTWLGLLAGISVGLVTASQFAVKDTGALAKQNPTVDDYIKTAVDIKNQYQEVKQAVTKAVESPADVSNIIDKSLGQEPLIYYDPIKAAKDKLAQEKQNSLALAGSVKPIDLSNPIIPTATLTSSTSAQQAPGSEFSNPAGNQAQ